jgi:hypothetical protein
LTIPEAVRLLASEAPKERRARLQAIIGHPARDNAELHWRALLATALREAKVWPLMEATA